MGSGSLKVLYFPYIDMDEAPLLEIMLYFKKIAFLRPSFWMPSAPTEILQKKGIVESRAPIQWDLDDDHVKKMLKEFESLISLYQDSGYLEYLKHGSIPFEDDERCHQIISEIRRYEEKSRPDQLSDRGRTDSLRGQLLLQLAQELESQRRELLGLYQEVVDKEGDIVKALGGDLEETVGNGSSRISAQGLISNSLRPEEDDFLIGERVRAWNEMYQRIDAGGFLLFTDNRCVLQYITDGLENFEVGGSSDQMIEEVARVSLPVFGPGLIEEFIKAREAIRRLPQWKEFEKDFTKFIATLNQTSWDNEKRKRFLSEGHGLSKSVMEALADGIIEGVHEQSRLILDTSRTLILKVFVTPCPKIGELLKRLYGKRALPSKRRRGNGCFLMAQPGGAIAREV